jgi:NAD(P)-dependent dehydrogenase (short-subunit alcohol dehydrogenase family)
MSAWTTHDIPPQSGRIALVTGATGGLGYETALALADAGADVILAGRNDGKGRAALQAIRASIPSARLQWETLDLASLASVADFSKRIAERFPRVDTLVNNAGVMALPKRKTTSDGFEMQFGTNYLGHFALTARLLPLLRASDSARVVSLASLAHRRGRIDFDDLQGERLYKPGKAYCQSKLAMLMFAFELQRRSDANGWGLRSNAAHPGWALTDLIANGPDSEGRQFVLNALSAVLKPWLSQSAAAGALPTLFAATSLLAAAAGYYGPSGFYELKGTPAPAKISAQASDTGVAARLWEASERLTSTRF